MNLKRSRRSDHVKKNHHSKGRTRRLRIESLESRRVLSSISWINPAGGAWDVASNWSGGVLPGTGDTVSIGTTAAATITVQTGDSITVQGLTTASNDTLSITGGSLVVTTGASALSGPLSMTGGSLTAEESASLTATGATTVSAASLYAYTGGSLSLPGLTTYANSLSESSTFFEASGTGSSLSLPGLTTVGALQSYWYAQAQAGGSLSMPALTAIGGASLTAYPQIEATGTGSQLNLSSLTSITAATNSYLTATASGTLLDGKLTSLTGINLSLDGTATMADSQWTTYNSGSIYISGGTFSLSGVTNFNSASAYVSGGASLSLPAVTSYATAETDYNTYFEATGAGSALSLPALTSVALQSYWHVQATQGGSVSVPALTAINAGGPVITADGSGSKVDISGVTSITASGVAPFWAATNQGTVLDGKLASFSGLTAVTLDGTGTIATAQWTTLNGDSIDITGGTYSLSGVTNIDSSNLYVSGGASLSLPAVASYGNSVFEDPTYFDATGTGSTLALPALKTLGLLKSDLYVQPTQGGTVSMALLGTVASGGNVELPDTTAPTSSVQALPATEPQTAFTVAWSGTDLNPDGTNGSGIASYNIYVSDNGGAFTLWQSATTQTSATFTGQNGQTYGFYSVATDHMGNVQATPSGAQTSTTIAAPVAVATQVAVTSDHPSGSTYGQMVTFTATVSPVSGTSMPTGSVQFVVGGVNDGQPVTLSNGTATMATAALGASATGQAIDAVYTSNSSNFAGNTSPNYMQVVSQATPALTWANPAGITAGTALSSTQLDATANVQGSFSYTPGAGTVLSAGSNQTLSVTFTPSDAVDYKQATATVSINVTPATSTPQVNGLLVLSASSSGALNVGGSGVVDVTNGAITVDSSNATAATFAGTSDVTASAIDVTGGVKEAATATVDGSVQKTAATANPFQALGLPPAPTTSFAAVKYTGSGQLTLNPGTYVGGISIGGSASVTLNPGVYYMKGGGFTVTGNASVTGAGVLLVNAPVVATDSITISSNGYLCLTAADNLTGTYAAYNGIGIFQAPTATNAVTVSGTATAVLTGVLYAPAAALNLTSEGGLFVFSDAASGEAAVIVNSAAVSGYAALDIDVSTPADAAAIDAYFAGLV